MPTRSHLKAELLFASVNFNSEFRWQGSNISIWSCFIIHTHDVAYPTNGGLVIQDQKIIIWSESIEMSKDMDWVLGVECLWAKLSIKVIHLGYVNRAKIM